MSIKYGKSAGEDDIMPEVINNVPICIIILC